LSFAAVYVVHCPRLHERKAYLEPILRRFGWDARWIEEGDPPIPAARLRRRARPTPEEVSVYQKHLRAMREIARAGHDPAFVLEDDPVFPDAFPETFSRYLNALPPELDLAFFGASTGLEVGPEPENPLFGREQGTRSMNGYLITARACRALLQALDGAPITAPIDLTLNRVIRERGLRVYWSVPPLIENGTETGLFAHSLGVGWRRGSLRTRLLRRLERLGHFEP
jgi:GR25 family glycosyltransferase involved in LPS biosynthesis